MYIFFTTFAVDYNLGKYGAIFVKNNSSKKIIIEI